MTWGSLSTAYKAECQIYCRHATCHMPTCTETVGGCIEHNTETISLEWVLIQNNSSYNTTFVSTSTGSNYTLHVNACKTHTHICTWPTHNTHAQGFLTHVAHLTHPVLDTLKRSAVEASKHGWIVKHSPSRHDTIHTCCSVHPLHIRQAKDVTVSHHRDTHTLLHLDTGDEWYNVRTWMENRQAPKQRTLTHVESHWHACTHTHTHTHTYAHTHTPTHQFYCLQWHWFCSLLYRPAVDWDPWNSSMLCSLH